MEMRIEEFEPGSVKVRMPKIPNVNHIGTVYAGSLFSLVDFAGGVLFSSCFDLKKYFPILKDVTIAYRQPATTDVTVKVRNGNNWSQYDQFRNGTPVFAATCCLYHEGSVNGKTPILLTDVRRFNLRFCHAK